MLRYRIDHGLDIDQLAARLGVDAEVVGVLEEGEDDPDIQTLRLLYEGLGLRFALDIHPARRRASRSSTRLLDAATAPGDLFRDGW